MKTLIHRKRSPFPQRGKAKINNELFTPNREGKVNNNLFPQRGKAKINNKLFPQRGRQKDKHTSVFSGGAKRWPVSGARNNRMPVKAS